MRKIGRLAGWLLLVAFLVQPVMGQALPVDALGGPERLTLEGVHAFSVKRIQDTLFRDCDVLAAARATAPLDEYLAVLERTVRAGYRHAGFADVKVSAKSDRSSGGSW